MINPAFVFGVLLVLQAPSPVPRQAVQNQRANTGNNKTAGAPNKPPATPLAVHNRVESDNADREAKSPARKDERKDVVVTSVPPLNVEKDTWDYIYVVTSILIMAATLLLAGTAFIQAKTAKAQSEAIVIANRAWVLIENLRAPALFDEANTLPDRPKATAFLAGIPWLVFNLKTFGTTPAKLTGSGARCHVVPRKEGTDPPEPDLPDEPVYNVGAFLQAGLIKAPNEKFQITVPLEDGPLSEEQWREILQKKLFVCAYGFVSYTDVFGVKHVTRFCYIYRVSYLHFTDTKTGENVFPNEFRLGGPEAYNSYTP